MRFALDSKSRQVTRDSLDSIELPKSACVCIHRNAHLAETRLASRELPHNGPGHILRGPLQRVHREDTAPAPETAKGTLAVPPRQARIAAPGPTDAPSGSGPCYAARTAASQKPSIVFQTQIAISSPFESKPQKTATSVQNGIGIPQYRPRYARIDPWPTTTDGTTL